MRNYVIVKALIQILNQKTKEVIVEAVEYDAILPPNLFGEWTQDMTDVGVLDCIKRRYVFEVENSLKTNLPLNEKLKNVDWRVDACLLERKNEKLRDTFHRLGMKPQVVYEDE